MLTGRVIQESTLSHLRVQHPQHSSFMFDSFANAFLGEPGSSAGELAQLTLQRTVEPTLHACLKEGAVVLVPSADDRLNMFHTLRESNEFWEVTLSSNRARGRLPPRPINVRLRLSLCCLRKCHD